tara:strand:+ start:101 stop:619 length:519 start_codon:yes stop_codon:yes gene_type:complete
MSVLKSDGNNFHGNLLNYANAYNENNDSNEYDSLEITYQLQKRLGNYYKNNQSSVLNKSKKMNGLVSQDENDVKSCCLDGGEFDFWNVNIPQVNKSSINIESKENFEEDFEEDFQEDFEEEDSETNIENFTNNKDFFGEIKENFNGSTVLSILVVLFVIGVIIFLNFFNKNK